MAASTSSRSRRAAEEDEEAKGAVVTVDDDDDEEETPTTTRARTQAADDDDDFEDDDDDDDESIVIGEGWDEAVAPSGDYPTVARGQYVILLSDVQTRKAGEQAKNPGQKYGVTVWKIQAEDNPSSMEDDDPTVTMWQNLFFTEKALGRTKAFVSGMGIEVKKGTDIMGVLREEADNEARYDAIIGIEKVRREDPNTGKMRNVSQNKILKILGPADL